MSEHPVIRVNESATKSQWIAVARAADADPEQWIRARQYQRSGGSKKAFRDEEAVRSGKTPLAPELYETLVTGSIRHGRPPKGHPAVVTLWVRRKAL